MNLTVRVSDALSPGGKALVLCDDAGEMLPGQLNVVFDQGMDMLAEITVTFLIDGDKVRMVG